MKDEFIGYDAIALGELVRKGEIKPAELLETVIQRIEKINPRINAVIHKMYDQARETAKANPVDGIFAGVPFLLKDLIAEYKGVSLEEGSLAVRGYVSKLDSELVRRQKAVGLIAIGKTNTSEYGLLPTTEPKLNGPTRNPWNPALTPGGSSGGSAAAVAAGIVPLAHGNDGGGSIRCPASCCGVFGLKPTRGRNPLGPLYGDWGTGLATEHAISRTVRDSAALLDATSGPDIGDPYFAPPRERPFLEEVGREPQRLKIGFLIAVPEGWGLETHLHPDCLNAVKDAASLCQRLGHAVEEINPQELGHLDLFRIFGYMFSCVAGRTIAYWEEELGKKITEDQVEPMTWTSYQAGLKRTGADYLGCLGKIQRFSRKIARWYHEKGYDMLLTSTLSIPPVKLGSFEPTAEDPRSGYKTTNAFVSLTFIQNITGQPAMSVPLYWNKDNIPIGVQFTGRFGDEAGLFRLAAQLEKERPWVDRRPPIHCSNPED
jgi:amidase